MLRIAKLSAEWTTEEILREINNWCIGRQYKWEPELGRFSKTKLLKLFMSVDGYGGTFRGRELYYTYREPLYVLNEYKVLEYFNSKQPKRYDAELSNSEDLTVEQRARRIRRQEAVEAGRSGKAYDPGKIKASEGAGHHKLKHRVVQKRQQTTRVTTTGVKRSDKAKCDGQKGSKLIKAKTVVTDKHRKGNQLMRQQQNTQFDADAAAILLTKKFGDRVRRLK